MGNPYYVPPYPSAYTAGYPYYQPQPAPQPQPQPQQQQADSNIIWVQGESGAKAYPVKNGVTVVLFDSEAKFFYLKSIDANGIPQPLRRFPYEEDTGEKSEAQAIDTSMFITREEFDAAIESLKNKQTYNNQGRNGKNGK